MQVVCRQIKQSKSENRFLLLPEEQLEIISNFDVEKQTLEIYNCH